MEAQATYNYKVVRQFSIMTVVWGIVGMLVGVIIAAQLVWPDMTLRYFIFVIWPFAATAYQCSDFCLWRVGAFCDVLLCRSTYLSHTPVQRRAGGLYLLGLAGW